MHRAQLFRYERLTYPSNEQFLDNIYPLGDGYMFKSWSDGITDNPRIIILQDNMSLGATFVKKGTIMLNVVGDGTVSGAGDYEIGTVVTNNSMERPQKKNKRKIELFYDLKSLTCCSTWGCKESDTTE